MKDPTVAVMEVCLGLARAETHNGVLEWFDTPLPDLVAWCEMLKNVEQRNKSRKR